MAKLVDARDLKSLVRKDVPVRPRLRAPFKIKGLRAISHVGPCSFLVRNTSGEGYFLALALADVLLGHCSMQFQPAQGHALQRDLIKGVQR